MQKQQYQNFFFGFIVIFILLMLIMPPAILTGNEENYLGLAWRKLSSDDLIQVSALRDGANHRFLFDYLIGFCINYIGFEWTHTLGHIVVALLYSASFVIFFKHLGLSISTSCTVILTFLWLGQDILGREWLFGGIEPKTLAYPWVFFSFSSSIKKKFNHSYLFLALATYFHFLVGCFWFFITFLYQLDLTRNFKLTLFQSLKYLTVCIPLFGMIFTVQLQSFQDTVNSTPTASWIYTYFRNPHHVAPFETALRIAFWYKHGIFFLFCLTIITVLLYYSSGTKKERKLSKIILFLNFYLIFALIISYFDKEGILGKFYLFRPSSVILFLTLCLYALFIKNRFSRDTKTMSLVALVLVSSLVIPTLAGHDYIGLRVVSGFLGKERVQSLLLEKRQKGPRFSLFVPNDFQKNKNDPKLEDIIKSSPNNSIFLIDPRLEGRYLSFERKYNRPTLVFKKFVPTTSSDIVRWYNLLKMKEELFERGCPTKMLEDYPIEYLLARNNRKSVANCGKELFRNDRVKLIKILK